MFSSGKNKSNIAFSLFEVLSEPLFSPIERPVLKDMVTITRARIATKKFFFLKIILLLSQTIHLWSNSANVILKSIKGKIL